MACRRASVVCAAALLRSTAGTHDASALYQHGYQLHRSGGALAAGASDDSEVMAQALGLASDGSEGPVSDVPWAELEKHQAALKAVHAVLKSVADPVEVFMQTSSRSKALMRAVARKENSTRDDLLQAMYMALDAVKNGWETVAFKMLEGLELDGADALKQQKEVQEILKNIHYQVVRFNQNVRWATSHGKRVVPDLNEPTPHVVAAQVDTVVVALKEMTKEKDSMVSVIFDSMDELTSHLGEQAVDPITNAGEGACIDDDGERYQSFERPGCESRFFCMSSCRKFAREECLGATFYTLSTGCGRCELRMERGFEPETVVDSWEPKLRDANGTGTIAGVLVDPNATRPVTCYKREVPEWDSWPPLMKSALETELKKLKAGYYVVSRQLRSALFKIDSSFWQFGAGLQEVGSKVLKKYGMHA